MQKYATARNCPERMSKNTNIAADTANARTIVWLILLVGLLVQSRTTLTPTENGTILSLFDIWAVWTFNFRAGGSAVFITLFDIVTPLMTLVALIRGWIPAPSRRFYISVLLVALAILAHTALLNYTTEQIVLSHLMKGTAKLFTLLILFACLYLIFSNPQLQAPPRAMIFGYFIVAIPLILYLHTIESIHSIEALNREYLHFHDPIYFSRPNQTFIFLGLLFFLASNGEWRNFYIQRGIIVIVSLSISAICFGIHSKTPAVIGVVFAIWFALQPQFLDSRFKGTMRFASLMVAAVLAVAGAYLIIYETSILPEIDSFQRSITVRLNLWDAGWSTFVSNFPLGAGAGQMGAALQQDAWASGESHLQVHNSFLHLAAELGIVGVAVGLSILWIVFQGGRAWPGELAPLFLILALLPLVIHDGHSIRIWLLIAALGLARMHYRTMAD